MLCSAVEFAIFFVHRHFHLIYILKKNSHERKIPKYEKEKSKTSIAVACFLVFSPGSFVEGSICIYSNFVISYD